jgi:hypothetical protein
MGLDHFAEREGSIDDRPQPPASSPLVMYSTVALRRVSSPLLRFAVNSVTENSISLYS